MNQAKAATHAGHFHAVQFYQSMVEGIPHAGMLKRVAGQIIEKVCRARKDCTVRAYGEMVNLLWQDGMNATTPRCQCTARSVQ